MRFLVFLFSLLNVSLVYSQIQDETEDECLINSKISHEAVGQGHYEEAYNPWKEVISNCPTLRYYTYSDGFEILSYLLSEYQKGSIDYNAYFEELMWLHQQEIQNIPNFLASGIKVTSVANAIGRRAINYLTYAPKVDLDLAYGWLKTAVDGEKRDSNPAILFNFIDISFKKFTLDSTYQAAFIIDYLKVSDLIDEAISSIRKGNLKSTYLSTKENIDAIFNNSGALNCDIINDIFLDRIEDNKEDVDYLKRCLEVMKRLGCVDQEAFEQASLYIYQVDPSGDAAVGVGLGVYKKGDVNEAIRVFNKAVELEKDPLKKAEKAYVAASILYESKRYREARIYILKALNLYPKLGKAYILLAKVYAANPIWTNNPTLNKCTFFLALDKLEKAKQIDEDCKLDADELIKEYVQQLPTAREMFKLGYKTGDVIVIDGWIKEKTTIR